MIWTYRLFFVAAIPGAQVQPVSDSGTPGIMGKVGTASAAPAKERPTGSGAPLSLDIVGKVLKCDSRGCRATTDVPIEVRQFYDDSISELRSESSALGWVFMSSGKQDKHFCPDCAAKYISPRKRKG